MTKKTFVTAIAAMTGNVQQGGKTHIEVGTRSVQFSDKAEPATYVRVLSGDSANTLVLAKGQDGKVYAALAIEAKPGIVPDGVDTGTMLDRTYKLRSGRVVVLPYGHTVGVFGGYLEPSDTSTLKGAMREALEEAGVSLEGVKILHAGKCLPFAAWGPRADSQYIALLESKVDFGPMTGGDISIAGRHWFTLEEAIELVLEHEGGVGGDPAANSHGAHAPAYGALLTAAWLFAAGKL